MDSKGEAQAPVDPLSQVWTLPSCVLKKVVCDQADMRGTQQILKRTSTAYIPQKPRSPTDHAVGQHAVSSGDGTNDPKHPLESVRGDNSGGASKDKK